MHFGVILRYFSSLQSGPYHECIHRSFYMLFVYKFFISYGRQHGIVGHAGSAAILNWQTSITCNHIAVGKSFIIRCGTFANHIRSSVKWKHHLTRSGNMDEFIIVYEVWRKKTHALCTYVIVWNEMNHFPYKLPPFLTPRGRYSVVRGVPHFAHIVWLTGQFLRHL